MINEEELAGSSTFCRLLKKNVRVVFLESDDRNSTCWIGELVRDGEDFIELRSTGGKPSFVNKRFIVAISEMRPGWQ